MAIFIQTTIFNPPIMVTNDDQVVENSKNPLNQFNTTGDPLINQGPLVPITDEDFSEAEVEISIIYNQISAVELEIGLEIGEKATNINKDVRSNTGLAKLTKQKTAFLSRNGEVDPFVKISKEEINTEIGLSYRNTFVTKVKEVGFSKEDLVIENNHRHWFLRIIDKNEKPTKIVGEEYTRPTGCLESFSVTVGDKRFTSLMHPVFAAGWEVTASITATPCGIFYKSTPSQIMTNGVNNTIQAKTASHWYWQRGEKIHGVAAVVGIAYFDSPSFSDRPSVRDSSRMILELLKGTGVWEVYYMITNGEYDDIDDSDIEWILGTVANEVNNGDHCFWYIETHGVPNKIATSNSDRVGIGDSDFDDIVTEGELCGWIDEITTKGAYLFYWMAHCEGQTFTDFWNAAYFHNYKALYWYYDDTSYSNMGANSREVGSFVRHVTIAKRTCQWMFGDTSAKKEFEYKRYDGQNDITVNRIEYAFEDSHTADDMIQRDTTSSDFEFAVAPNNNNGWTPSCRTRDSHSIIASGNYAMGNDPYQLTAYETSGGTFRRYVGFYKKFYVPQGDSKIVFNFEAKASSSYWYSGVTNFQIKVYKIVDNEWYYVNGASPSELTGPYGTGWKEISVDIDIGSAYPTRDFAVFFCYSDGWSTNWNQKIWVKNLYIGNVIDKLDNGDFEEGQLGDWVTDDNYPATVTSYYYFVKSGLYGCGLDRYTGGEYYTSFIYQSVRIPLIRFSSISYYARTHSYRIRMTIFLDRGTSYTYDSGLYTNWHYYSRSKSQMSFDSTSKFIVGIKFEKLCSSTYVSTTVAIDDITINYI